MYIMLCTKADICYVVGMVNRYQSNLGLEHWTAVKHIFKYLKRTRNYMLTYGGSVLRWSLLGRRENLILKMESHSLLGENGYHL